jgi:predicted nucleotidyltransferase
MDREAVIALVRAAFPDVIALYLFGSCARGDATARSDVDLAVLSESMLDPVRRFETQECVAALLRRDVDLVDLRRASAVMRVRVLADAAVLFDADRSARQRFEAFALSDYARLNEERRGILEDARRTGTVHG